MNVVVLINGREAIPVRAIPFVTGRWMSPDVVARSFALTDHWRDMKEVSAYQLLGDVIHGPVLPKEWDVVEDLLQALENRLKSLSDDRTETRPTWITESTLLLPAAVFVWKDQFEQYFRAEYSPQRFHWIDERPGDRELNFSPMIMPPELRSAVMEGFESQVENTPPTDTVPQVPEEAREQAAPSGTSEKAAPEVTLDDDGQGGKGLVAWQAVMLENWPKIAEHDKKPPARAVMKWLRENGPHDTFPKGQNNRDSLPWRDTYGQLHTLTLRRIGTVLSEWRKTGKIPA